MSITIHISGRLKPYTNGEVEVVLDGEFATVGEALDSLWKQHTALRDRVLNEQGEIRQHVNIFVGSEDIKRKDGLNFKLKKSNIHIFNAVSGG